MKAKFLFSQVLFILLMSLNSLSLLAQETNAPALTLENLKITRTVNWEEGVIYLDVIAPITEDRSIFPINRIASEKFVMDNLGQIIQNNLVKIPLNSQETLGDYLQKNPDLILSLRNTYKDIWRSYSRVSTDFQSLSLRYALPIYPNLAEILTTHKVAYEKPIFVSQNETKQAFTGIVIYVNKSLMLSGDFKRGQFLPSLFPKLYDENLNLFFEKEMVDPIFLKKWGINSYTNDPMLYLHKERIGDNPFYLSARALYGISPTDLVISSEDINRIVSLENNKNLLKEGRLVFVLEELPCTVNV